VNITFTPNRQARLQKRREAALAQLHTMGKDSTGVQEKPRWGRNFSNSFTLSVFNVYNRYNPYFIYLTREGDFTQGTLKVGAKQVSLFPIIPSLTWNFKF